MAPNPTPDSPASPPPPPEAAPAEAGTKPEDRTMAMLCHLLGIVTWFLGSLIVWLIKKDQSKFVDEQGKEALNFQLTLFIGDIIAVLTCFVGIGFVIAPVIWVIRLVFCILAAM